MAALIDDHVSFLALPDFHEFNVHHVRLCCCTPFAALKHSGLCGSFPNHIEPMATQHGRWICLSTSPNHVLCRFWLILLFPSAFIHLCCLLCGVHFCGFLMNLDSTHTLVASSCIVIRPTHFGCADLRAARWHRFCVMFARLLLLHCHLGFVAVDFAYGLAWILWILI